MELLNEITRINQLSDTWKGTRELAEAISDDFLVTTAIHFAMWAHEGQVRKYTDIPYVTHTIAVANIVRLVGGTTEQITAAVLHDTVEDTDVEMSDIVRVFGHKVASLVSDLTDVSQPGDGSRDVRKALDRQHTAQASVAAKTVKLADLIHNTFSIVEHDSNFAKVYLSEKIKLLEVLSEGDSRLLSVARHLTASGLETLAGAAASAGAFVRDDV